MLFDIGNYYFQERFGNKIGPTRGLGNVVLASLIQLMAGDDHVVDIVKKCPFRRWGFLENEFTLFAIPCFSCRNKGANHTTSSTLKFKPSSPSAHPYIGRLPHDARVPGYFFPMELGSVFFTDGSALYFDYTNVNFLEQRYLRKLFPEL